MVYKGIYQLLKPNAFILRNYPSKKTGGKLERILLLKKRW